MATIRNTFDDLRWIERDVAAEDMHLQMLQTVALAKKESQQSGAEHATDTVCQDGLRSVLAAESSEQTGDASMHVQLLQTAGRAVRTSTDEPIAPEGVNEIKETVSDHAQVSLIQNDVDSIMNRKTAGTDFDASGTMFALMALAGLILLLHMFFSKFLAKSTRKRTSSTKEKDPSASPVTSPSADLSSADMPAEPITVRAYVTDLQVSSFADVQDLLVEMGGFDSTDSKPLKSGKVLRLQVRVEGPVGGKPVLKAPLSQQDCVFYRAAARCHSEPPVVACTKKSEDFVVSLADAPWVKVDVEAQHAQFFDICQGKWSCQCALLEAPEHLQDFVYTCADTDPEKECETISELRAGDPCADFQEVALHVGTIITLVGELHRSPDGRRLSLIPCGASPLRGLCSSQQDMVPLATGAQTDDAGVVLLSDDTDLLKTLG